MNRREFASAVGIGVGELFFPQKSEGESVQHPDFKPWWEVTRVTYWIFPDSKIRGRVTYYSWPQDRYIAFESVQPDGKKDELIVPTFSLAEAGTILWTQIKRAIQKRSWTGLYAAHCSVIQVRGLKDEVGIVTCTYPMRPLVNPNPRRTDWADKMEILTLGPWGYTAGGQ